ncbi:Protein-L-isoaspartate O-methyltransferase [Candidatus Rhodobacter oscarellae]|uniref:Protein-L-isoaspartate O-methyltransferase n=1 Tax=Candidatus Rhodobacter oscarellae TaxID=1675527 RepID=A0A0J9E4V4_9RHOB|nr:methyltransferase domain-containing protein [Candidatus Rhodobacter lobularis]KMW56844.1 Protein-L-isoaspartate O-methyltransferase [Candidatus Rhodobacter lobularis]
MHADHFIDQLRVLAALDDNPATNRTLAAFKSVAREDFVGNGPWKLRSALGDVTFPPRLTPDADPKWLYHSVLVVLDEEKGINIGDPSLWVSLIARADVQPGARVLQVGAGVGYYTAILSKLVGPTGHIVAYEVEEALAERAARNLADYENVEVRHGNAATDLTAMDQINLVVAFAGVTHVPDLWTTRLASDARLLLPLTGEEWWGAMILAKQTNCGFSAITLGRCGFYPCIGARRDDLAAKVSALFAKSERLRDWPLRIIGRGDEIRLEAAAT